MVGAMPLDRSDAALSAVNGVRTSTMSPSILVVHLVAVTRLHMSKRVIDISPVNSYCPAAGVVLPGLADGAAVPGRAYPSAVGESDEGTWDRVINYIINAEGHGYTINRVNEKKVARSFFPPAKLCHIGAIVGF